ncbi:timeless protein-domain-containing protein [Apodospora peruviana]|uniref:Topoisomerase 1-associated factor 1 n=1 Tax=Apodospora peruviana TaxID=516989 RepID=A0AAE0IK65_9PEZI|nr:timeless protein-domain-containing protein [Apodospora peruviana]
MEAAEINTDTVHPEVRAHINSLVSALGGLSVDDDDGYKLGDDALEVLRDLKRWIRFYDEKTNRMDVARCLAETNLVGNDLLQILATWPPNCNDNKYKARIALACFEVMVPLTWPIEKDKDTMTVNHHRHMPVLQLAQLGYKRAIINFDAAPILNTAVRVALPSMAIPIGDRSPRDQGIIKLVLFFLRNMAMITPPPGIQYDGDESQISRSATIDAFSYQDIFLTLLTIASNMGEDFRSEDTIIMETIFHIVKRVDSSKLFVTEKALNKEKANELSAAMNKEAAMLRAHNKNMPTRHSRFGTMIWVKRENGKLSTVTGQDALLNTSARERKIDSSKTFRPPRRARKEEMEPKDLGPPVSLDERARQQLRTFVEDFLDSGFNPLFQHVRKSIDREAPHILHEHRSQFFYLVAWFLEAERMRRKAEPSKPAADEVGSFNLVASVLNQEMFITLNRALDRSYSDKDWQQLTTVMRCFTQILFTVQEMTDSNNEDDQEIADNILSRLFYEEMTHDLIANIIRTHKDQGFEYLDACTELTHTFLRILEAYSKQNVDLQVRSRKRIRRKKKAAKAAVTGELAEDGVEDDADESADDEQDAEKTSQERKFDFKKFTQRFVPQGVVDTFVKFTKFYRDLDDSQLKRSHRYFHRVAFKQDMSVMLFRLDIIHLFYNMIKGPEPLDKNSAMFKEWEELAKQVIKKCVRKLEERPALFTELLFSKINSTAHYLEYGHDKQTITSNPRPAAELEFKGAVEQDQQVAIVVGVLLDKSQSDHLQWLKQQLSAAADERRAWEGAELAKAAEKAAAAAGTTTTTTDGDATPAVVKSIEEQNASNTTTTASSDVPPITLCPDDDARRTAMFKNAHLRLLMKLVSAERLAPSLDETPDSVWCFPGRLTSEMLQESIDQINKAEFSPPTFEDGESAADQLRRKSAAAAPRPRKRATFDDDEDGDGLIDEGDILFPMGGPTARKSTAEGRPPKKRQRRRLVVVNSDGEEVEEEAVTDEQAEARARARRLKQLEKARKIKSDMYVHVSDDESDVEKDQEFFKRENAIRAAKEREYGAAGTFGAMNKKKDRLDKVERDLMLGSDDGDDDDDDDESDDAAAEKTNKTKKRKSDEESESGSASDEDDNDDDEASGFSSDASSLAKKRRRTAEKPTKKRRRKGAAAAVVVVNSDEEDDDDEDEEMLDSDLGSSSNKPVGGESNTDTPLSSQSNPNPHPPGKDLEVLLGGADDEDDDVVAKAPAVRSRVRARAGFIMDSSDDE